MRTKILAVATLALMAVACQKNGGDNPQPEPGPAPASKTIDLATVTADTSVEDGFTLTGTLGGNYKISIAPGATVTLDNVTINGVDREDCPWAGITCEKSGTILLKGKNRVKGFCKGYPGIYVPVESTLWINEDSDEEECTLYAGNNGDAAGIGAGAQLSCGNIQIVAGNIHADGDRSGKGGAGIGGACEGNCGNIFITNGIIYANGGKNSAGIGGGYDANCGKITIGLFNPNLRVTRMEGSPATIGKGAGSGTCGTVTIYNKEGEITDNPFVYPLLTLATINSSENTDFLSGSKTFGNAILSITGEQAVNDGSTDGWHAAGELGYIYLTIGAAEGYTMTRIEFDIKEKTNCMMTNPTRDGTYVICVSSSYTYNSNADKTGPGGTNYGECGPNSIRVYGYKNE